MINKLTMKGHKIRRHRNAGNFA